MLNYFDFISEAAKLETSYYYSDRFRIFLTDIVKSKENEVASFLLNSEESGSIKDDITFIDITDKNDMVSFLQLNRISKMWGDSKDTPLDEWIKLQSIDKDSNVWKDQRSELSIGRFVRRVCVKANAKFTDYAIEKFVNLYKSTFDSINSDNSNFELVSGNTIKYWYHKSNYELERGQLGNSCMRYDSCKEFFKIYTENKNQVNLLILKSQNSPGKISGRALVWKTKDDKIIMDRVYTIRDSDYQLFTNHADKMNWLYGSKISIGEFNKLEVKLDVWIFDKYPYMDTFVCLNKETGILSANEENWPTPGWYRLQSTDGSYDSDNVVWSEYHSEYINRSEATYCERSRDWVYNDSATHMEYLNIWASPDEDIVYSSYTENNYYSEDTSYSEFMSTYILEEESIKYNSSTRGVDCIHKDFENLLIEIEFKGVKVLTIESCLIMNPIDNKWYFKDDKINGLSIVKYVSDNHETVSEPELRDYILDNKFDINDHKDFYNSIVRYNDGSVERLHELTKFKIDDLNKMVRYMLISSPGPDDRSANYNKINIKSTWNRFKESIIHYDKESYDRLISTELDNYFKNTWNNISVYNGVIFSEKFVNVFFTDPVMLATYYKIKWK